MRRCYRCGLLKNETDFHKQVGGKDGLRGCCKPCHCAEVREYNEKHRPPTRYEKTHRTRNGKEEKLCIQCNIWQYIENFPKARGSKQCKDGRFAKCKECRQKRKIYKWSIPNNKTCSICEVLKPSCDFSISKRDGISSSCKECRNKRTRERYWKDINKTRENDKLERQTLLYKLSRRPAELRRRKDRIYRLHYRMGNALRRSMGKVKNGRCWEQILGFTSEQLRQHLESQFTEGMTWEKFLGGEIHIDHKIPKSFFVFDSGDDVEFKMCWRLENLQPMWAKDNFNKNCKLTLWGGQVRVAKSTKDTQGIKRKYYLPVSTESA